MVSAFTVPEELIVATDEALLDHTPLAVASESVVEELLHIVVVPDIADGAAGTLFTVKVVDA